ncbi:MAG: tripartite tricarboxylate transporter TctB family protein [candidate division NC10 bacterium]|nr:tripartite tricarboxylate transporter TctB family protein [candidate division NC10 bacterium]
MIARTADKVVAVILMAIGLLVAYDGLRLGAGWGLEGPKAGFFPLLMSVLVVGGCLVIIRQAVTGRSSVKGEKPFVLPGGLKPVLTVVLPALGMVILTEIIGLYLAAMIYLAAYIRLVGGFRWRTVLLVSIPIPLIFYWLFDKMFLIPMPMGMFGAQILRF